MHTVTHPPASTVPSDQAPDGSDRPIRLLVVNSRYLPVFSGAALQLHEVLTRLGPERVDVTVLTLRHEDLARRETVDGVHVIRLGRGGIHRPARLLFAIETVLYILMRGRTFDVVHGFAAGWAGFLVPLATALARVPSVFSSTLRGSDDAASIQRQGLGSLKLRLMRLYGAITTYTPDQSRRFTEAGFPSDSVFTLTCGVDDDYYCPGTDKTCRRELRQAAGRDDAGPVVLFIGTLNERKGVDILVEAFRHVLARHPSAVLVLMGPKDRTEDPTLDEGFVRRIQSRCESSELRNHVAFLGRIFSSERKRSILRASDIFALFSDNEGLGIVVLEAMACGIPPVLTPIPGVFDFIVDDGRNGRISRTRDVEELSGALDGLLSSAERRQAMGQRARETVTSRFSMSRIVSQYLDLYRRLSRQGTA